MENDSGQVQEENDGGVAQTENDSDGFLENELQTSTKDAER